MGEEHDEARARQILELKGMLGDLLEFSAAEAEERYARLLVAACDYFAAKDMADQSFQDWCVRGGDLKRMKTTQTLMIERERALRSLISGEEQADAGR